MEVNSDGWLCDDVIERILSFFSTTDILKAALVCKQWRSFIICSPILRCLWYTRHKCRPWLFVLGANKRRGLGFDPAARRWIRLPPFSLHSNEQDAVIMEGNGFLFSVAGGRLKLRESFLNPRKWEESAAAMRVWRQNPVVCHDRGKMVVIGGVHELEEDTLSAEMLDLKSGGWEMCDPLPEEFRQSASSTWLSSTVFNGRVYVLEKYKGYCCCYELQSKRWGKVMDLRPWALSSSCECVKYFCFSCSGGLVLAGLIREDGGMSFRMCFAEEEKMEFKVGTEIQMPGEMLKLITGRAMGEEEEEEEEEFSSYAECIECRGAGDLVYVFSKSRYVSTRRVCLFDFTRGVWEMWADVDDDDLSVKWRDRVLFVCSPVTLREMSLDFKA